MTSPNSQLNDEAVVLITGGTGSFGSVLASHLLEGGIGQVRILSRDETKQDAMRRWLHYPNVRFFLGDVRDYWSVDTAMKGVTHVFHASALKQVPSCEFFPAQAVATNVTGAEHVIRSADVHGVKSVVCLSTDKAVYPINAMGMSKALMEKVAAAYARSNPDSQTVVTCTRYGNVLYSRGSVVPLFVEQLKAGQRLTVTNPRMTRFLMTLHDSVDLVKFAMTQASPGDLFVRKAPAATIEDLATATATLFGVEPDIEIIGTRHAEKLYESLLTAEEMAKAEDMGPYYRVPLDGRSLDYSVYTTDGKPEREPVTDYNSHNTEQLTVEGIIGLLETLPEIAHAKQEFVA